MKTKCALFVFFLQAGFLFSTNPPTPSSWTGVTNMDWVVPTNWSPSGVAPILTDSLAQLINGDGASPVITFSANANVGSVQFDLGTPYTLMLSGASGLIFSVTTGSANIIVTTVNGTAAHVIGCTVALASPLLITQPSTANFTISGVISGAQSLTKSGAGVLTLSSGPGNTYMGGTVIAQGSINAISNTDNQLGSGSVTIGSAALEFTNGGMPLPSMRSYILTGASQINTNSLPANPVTINSPGPLGISGIGSLEKIGSGTLILQSVNTYQGGTIISAGQLNISNDNNLGNATGFLHIGAATLLTTTGITSSRSGSFTGTVGTPSIIDTGGGANNDTFTGNFGSVGALRIQGGGTVTFLGTNSYNGGTTVTGGGTTLAGNTNGVQGNIALDAGTLLSFNQGFAGTYSGSISSVAATNGTVSKAGAGTILFTGNSAAFSGPTNITAGTLNVNGSLANSSLVTVSLGATLGGTGTVGTTSNSGTISPGNSIGTLTVNGMLTLNATSTVIIEIAPLSSDVIAVVGAPGTATISGALIIEPTPGFYGFTACYTILTSSGLVLAPGFGPITSTNSSFVPTVTYPGNNVLLCLQILRPFAVFPFSNANTRAVGNNIDDLFASGQLSADLTAVFNSFVGQSFAVINDALDQMHPAPLSALTEMQAEIGGQLISLFHRMPYLPCACANPNRFWLEPFGNSLTLKKHGMQIGSQSNTGGLALGYDGEILENLIFGFGGAWSSSHLDWHDHRGHADVNGFYGGVYTDYQIGQFYVGGAILAGVDFYDTSRHIEFVTTNRHAQADYKALDIMAQLATAYLFGSPLAYFYPYANFDFLYLRTHKFSENGASGLDLTVQARSDATLRTEMGLALQVQDVNAAETMCISPQVSIGWVNMCPLERDGYKSTFAGASIPFTTHGWKETWNLLHVDFGLSFAYRCYSLGLQYNVEISPDSETTLFNQHGNIQFDWKW